MNQWVTPEIDIAFIVGSFGASAVLVFAVLESKMSQPRNFVGGQVLSALVGVTTRVVIPEPWIAGPVGMSLALVAMQLTSTTHPPGGATALIACSMATLPKWHGYSYLVTVAVGSVAMLAIALLVNNLDPRRRYPTFWW
jgi:CBS-domain-containing membrane protein